MQSNWLFGRKIDLSILFLPVWLCWLVAFLLPQDSLQTDVPLWVWVSIVIGIDVSHVWSSIFRTYLEKDEFSNHRKLLLIAPVASFLLSFGIAFISIDLFWRCLAYVAVYHFIKQQYGFMRIYKAKAKDFEKRLISDNFVIYLSMLYPVLYWHLSDDRAFAWFVQGDFISIDISLSKTIFIAGNTTYFLILTAWLFQEVRMRGDRLPIGKILWVLTTAGNWFIGIVYFNSDIVFTITNVVAHGIPYLALIVFYQTRKKEIQFNSKSIARNWKIATSILVVVLLLAFTEEYLWDFLVYRENVPFFSDIIPYFIDQPGTSIQLVAIGLLAVPQVTHYIIDGFIWKNNARNPYIKTVLLG